MMTLLLSWKVVFIVLLGVLVKRLVLVGRPELCPASFFFPAGSRA